MVVATGVKIVGTGVCCSWHAWGDILIWENWRPHSRTLSKRCGFRQPWSLNS